MSLTNSNCSSSTSSISEYLHSWKTSSELRSRLLSAISDELLQQKDDGNRLKENRSSSSSMMKELVELFSSITSSTLSQSALSHDTEVLTSLLQLLTCIIEKTSSCNNQLNTTTTGGVILSIHSRHVSSLITALQNHRRSPSGNEKGNNNKDKDFTIQLLFLYLLYSMITILIKEHKTLSLSLLPTDSISSAVQSLLDTDYFAPTIMTNEDENDDDQDSSSRFYFSILQQLLTTEPGQRSFIKYGGAAIFKSQKYLISSSIDAHEKKSASVDKRRKITIAERAISVLHAATSSLDICIELNKFGVIQDVIELLNHEISSSSPSLTKKEKESNISIPLHCLGFIQNVLREISCSKQFWSIEKNISVLVKASLDPIVVDESIKSQAMLILLANAANNEREVVKQKKKKNGVDDSDSVNTSIKNDLKRCLTAAHTLSMVEESIGEEMM